jgi:3-phosphoshikimate 1-carboxyvinyltransferase
MQIQHIPAIVVAPAVEQLTVQPIKTISGTVKLPGSKSLSNRILLLAALAEGTTVVRNLLVRVEAVQPCVGSGLFGRAARGKAAEQRCSGAPFARSYPCQPQQGHKH